jgi:hypothetical protein
MGVLRSDMPVEVIFARHALRAPLHRTNILRWIGGCHNLSLVRLSFLVTFEVFPGVFAVLEVYLTGLARVRSMSSQT